MADALRAHTGSDSVGSRLNFAAVSCERDQATSLRKMSDLAFWSSNFMEAESAAKAKPIPLNNPAVPQVPFVATRETISADAKNCAEFWLNSPANKMQLKSLQAFYDLDGNNLIDREEWRELLRAAGSKADAEALFTKLDKDKDGLLDEDEIKALRDWKRERAREHL